jgi:phenylacetate-coenzyme A ligase PaaK-like adenylate-forming protein
MHPAIVRAIVFPLQEFAKGKPTLARLIELEKSQWFSREQIRALQLERLRQLLSFAYKQVPYYRELFDEHRIVPDQIRSLKDLSRIPMLEKTVIRSRFDDLHPQHLPGRVQKMSTGGSTGSPVTILVDSERAAFTDAARMRAHRWYDADMGEREIVLWGSPIELGGQGMIKDLRDRLINSRLLSAFDMSEDRMLLYGEYIARYRPVKMYGYASALYLLAACLRKSGWKPPQDLKVVFATAEPLFDFQRRTVQEVFDCSVSAEYGARDAGLMANECPQGGLHIPAEGTLIEIDSPGGGAGEIIATNLFSKAMPIIRYRTGDIGELEQGPCGCGRGLPRLKSVQGRQTDFLVTPSGKIVHALAIIYAIREMPGIKEFQVLQDEFMHVLIRVVTTAAFSNGDREQLLAKANIALGKDVQISLEKVSEISRSASGKFRYVISKAAETRLGILAKPHESQIA